MNGQVIFQIFRSALLERRTMGSLTVYWILLALTLGLPLIPLLAQIKLANTVALLIFVSMLYAMLISALPQLVINGVRLATPHYNQTLPGLSRHLYWYFGIVIFSASIILALLASLALGHFLLFALGISSSLLLMSFLYAPGEARLAIPLAIAVGILSFTWLPGWVLGSGLWDNQALPSAMALALVLLMFHLLARRIFAVKGERAWFVQKKLDDYTEMITGETSKTSAITWAKLLGASHFYDASLARAIQQPVDKPRLLIYGLGYGLHWSVVVSNVAWIISLGGFLAISFFVIKHDAPFAIRIITLALALAVSGVPIGVIRQGIQALQQHRQEQHLLKLLPAGVQGHGYNRLIALTGLRQFGFTLVCTVLPAALLLAVLWGQGFDLSQSGFNYLPPMLVAALPLSLATLDNYASMQGGYRNTWFYYVATILLGIVLTVIGIASPLFLPAAAIVVIATLAGLKRRWKQTLAAPVAIPTGRLAKP